MNYTEMLNKLIVSSGKMVKDIADECSAKYDVNLTRVYLSNLKTQEGRIPSEEISRAIAEVCGSPYKEILVIQAYLDRAPAEIIEFLQGIQSFLTTSLPIEEDEALKELLKAEGEQPLAEFICKYAPQMQVLKKGIAEAVSEKEPKWIVIPPEQVKGWKLIKESDIKRIFKD